MLIFVLIIIISAFTLGIIIHLLFLGPILLLKPQRMTPALWYQNGEIAYPEQIQKQYTEITIVTPDGIPLNVWILPAENPVGTLIYLHGVGDCKSAGLPIAEIAGSDHWTVVLPDMRAHGLSGGDICTYGWFERNDVSALIATLERDHNLKEPVVLMGLSMGAAIALQTQAIEPKVKAVIAEASFTSLEHVTFEYQKTVLHIHAKWLNRLVLKISGRIGKFPVDEVSPLKSVENQPGLRLFIHGTNDVRIPYEDSLELSRRANGTTELLTVQGADHTGCRQTGGAEYALRILKFLKKVQSA